MLITTLPQVCNKFETRLQRVCSEFATSVNDTLCPYLYVMCLQVANNFRVAVSGGPQNKPLIGPHAHLQECGNDGVGPPNGHPKLIGHSDGFAVLQEDAQCMASGAQKWTSDITEGSVGIDEIKNVRCKGDDHHGENPNRLYPMFESGVLQTKTKRGGATHGFEVP
jgi:hypothetical protein